MAPRFCANCYKLIAAVLSYFDREKANNGPLLPISASRERAADSLEISKNTVCKISTLVATGQHLAGPSKRRRGKTVTNISENQAAEIRNVIFEMHVNKEHITRHSLLERLLHRYLFVGSLVSLGQVLRKIGFRFKREENRVVLMELPRIALLRADFLRTYMNNLASEGRQVVFVDETWIFENGATSSFSWQDVSANRVRGKKVSGKRHIVVHAGNRSGFIEEATLIFASETNNSDYHSDMNEDIFLEWFEHQLLISLKEPSLIVMDSASYHSTLVAYPTSSWRKVDMQQWLRDKNIPFEDTMLKTQLLALINRHNQPKLFKADELAQQYGHEVLRLPPYHCIFNPIDLIWGVAKNYYNTHMGRDGIGTEKSMSMWREALDQITPEVWKDSVDHTEKIIKEWWTRELLFDSDDARPLTITLGEGSGSESDMESHSDMDAYDN